jgi:uncharacterized protein (TIGR03437 family)
VRAVLGLAALSTLSAHAPPTPIPVPPLSVQGNSLIDSTRTPFVLRGVQMPGLETGSSAVAAMTPFTFQIIQQRWNMNAVRLPVSVALWKRDPSGYLGQVAGVVASANRQSLVVVLAAYGADDAGLPASDTLDFWRAAAALFKDTPRMIFSLYNQPSVGNIPGSTPGAHRAADWQVWLSGGALTGGRTAIGMQALVDAIRAAGAKQVIAAPAFHDALGFQGFTSDAYLRDANILYEIHPFFDQGTTDEARDRNFGFLLANFPVFAGEWGAAFGTADPSCLALPADNVSATGVMLQTTAYFDRRGISWTAADFAPGSLIRDFNGYVATMTGPDWNCAAADGRTGIGQFILFWMTGDPNGFGSLDPAQIASAAGGAPGPVAPGQLLSLYGQSMGPVQPLGPEFAAGRVTTSLGDVQVLFDGVPAPMLLSGYFQVNVQVPYEVASRQTTTVQLVNRGVPSNSVQLAVAASAPGIFTKITGGSDASLLNQDGTVNDPSNPAARGSVIALFATGAGQTTPASATGVAAGTGGQTLAVTVSIGSRAAEVLYAGPAPGLVGVMQVNVRVPADLPLTAPPERASVVLTVGGVDSRTGVVFWAK